MRGDGVNCPTLKVVTKQSIININLKEYEKKKIFRTRSSSNLPYILQLNDFSCISNTVEMRGIHHTITDRQLSPEQ